MRNEFETKAISKKLSKQIDDMIIKIKESFGLDINKIEASKIVAWKSRKYTVALTDKKLLEILGDRDE